MSQFEKSFKDKRVPVIFLRLRKLIQKLEWKLYYDLKEGDRKIESTNWVQHKYALIASTGYISGQCFMINS